MNRRQEILRWVAEVPALPSATGEVCRVCQDSSRSLDELCSAIECDPGLTANLLRLVNSAYFGYSRAIETVRQAVVRLGTREVMQLAIAASVFSKVQGPVKGYDLPPGALWHHALGVGIGATELARRLGVHTGGSMFVAGLLADIGKLLLGTFVEADADAIWSVAYDQGVPFDGAERAVLGIDHAELGARLLDQWNLPERLVRAAHWHHRPQCAPTAAREIAFVHAADAICMMLGFATGCDGLHYEVQDQILGELGITTPLLDSVASRVVDGVREMERVLEPGSTAAVA